MRRALIVIGLTLVLVLGLVVWRADDLGVSDLVDDLTGASDPPPASEGPAAVPPPPGLDLPRLPDAQPVARERVDRAIDPRAVRQSLGRLTRDKRLGPRVAVAVAGPDGRPAYEEGPRVVTPASLLKTAISLAALELLGPEHRFTTSVVRRGGVLTLVGGGDPLLTGAPDPGAVPRRADLTTLARQTATALRAEKRGGPARVTLRYDDSLFSGPAVSPDWENDYIPDNVVSPITALWIDVGREFPGALTRSADPSRAAALRFAEALRAAGTTVVGSPRPGAAPDVDPVASVASAPLVEVVQHVLETSDNEGAEVLLRQVGLADAGARGGSFAAGSRAVSSTLADLGVPLRAARILDGSGLARGNRMAVSSLLEVLATSLEPKRPLLAGVTSGLPVAGFTGSLASGRFEVDAVDGLGWVRAKTGTLTGVHGLAGSVTGRDGTPMLFVAVVDRVKIRNALQARARLDQIASALADCRCAAR
ncbi:D-alanyl-D-alanine carboxypeptidase/D-alanyl-D-alanine-endopeptidase [Nocardioides sp. HDW12B]|uniref:D-alanyl-D-alanine carboxypeptidase/D-alanyl-D-alanine endopeptidase n=1 Tax=Nocardioides sp. HDW12B TaxID=2714939 RepID=UPI001408646F|nr:D-alanyl-D-alanine carboxypeptidase/D-alanyl-D-alanine-endopeptidase [Nocardioides sp. HDW12B]QIK65071.1 D-alanyl-D-alanine carboxypeptidase/D-alanyl-D-alanine-endopeptidase [Nocardioides sp. HDW12B]